MHPWALGREGTHRTVSQTDRRGKPLKTVVCMETGLVRNDPVPGDAELAKFYAEDYRKDYKSSEKPRRRPLKPLAHDERVFHPRQPRLFKQPQK